MTRPPRVKIALGFPVNEQDRQLLRELAPDYPLPAIYESATLSECDECGMAVSVGPRTAATMLADPGYTLLCVICAVQDVKQSGVTPTLIDLGGPPNPEKR